MHHKIRHMGVCAYTHEELYFSAMEQVFDFTKYGSLEQLIFIVL